MNYYSFHIGDYRSATAHLTNEEDLCYRRILDTYYDKDGNLPEIKLLSRQIRCEEAMVLDILAEFFERVEGGWLHRRAQKEVDDYLHRVESARLAGKASAAARTRPTATEPQRPLNGTSTTVEPPLNDRQLTIPHYPFPNNHLPPNPPAGVTEEVGVDIDLTNPEKPERDLERDFNEFWEAYPENRRKNRYRAESAWSGCRHLLPPQNELLGALEAFKSSSEWKREGGKYIGSAQEWIQERRWQDAPAYSAPKNTKTNKKEIPKVDEAHARAWLGEHYVGVDTTMKFAEWPPFAQNDYMQSHYFLASLEKRDRKTHSIKA